MTWDNTEIEVTGSPTLFEKIESQFIVKKKAGATASYIDVTWSNDLCLTPNRYYFNLGGEVHIITTELVRMLIADGHAGNGYTIMTVEDDVSGTPLPITITLQKGIFYLWDGEKPVLPPVRLIVFQNVWTTLNIEIFASASVFTNPCHLQYLTSEGPWMNMGAPVTLDGYNPNSISFTLATIENNLRIVDDNGDVIWQTVEQEFRGESDCAKIALVEWMSDYGNKKNWVFEILNQTRTINQSETLINDNSSSFAGSFFKRKSNQVLSLELALFGLSEQELRYFDDLFMSDEVTCYPSTIKDIRRLYNTYGAVPSAMIKDKKVVQNYDNKRRDLHISLDLFTIKSY